METSPMSNNEDLEIGNKRQKKVHKLSLKETENFNEKLRRRGVVYLSRIPPRMGPSKVKALLGEFGTVTRVYLEEEDKAARKRRLRASGSKSGGKRYKEGWIEFEDKKVAKRVALALNSNPITNHKRSVHADDIWNIKYLSKFQWSHLTEKVAFERRVREQKLKISMMEAKKENQTFTNLVESAKVMDKISERREKHGKDKETRKRKFRQTAPVTDESDRPSKSAVLGSLV